MSADERDEYGDPVYDFGVPGPPKTTAPENVVPIHGPGLLLPQTRTIDGAQFIGQAADKVPALWGIDGDSVLWAKGEPLMIVGPDGVGKTSLGQQALLCRIGIRDHLLGLPVQPAAGKVLYIAADRPRQAATSMRRMVCPADDDLLRERLVVWKGPLLESLIGNPELLVRMADEVGATDIVIDSLKDVAADLVKDETGSHVSIAFQALIASERELLVLHHQRKGGQGAPKPTIQDVYGSRWLTAGMGSVLLLWGEAGDPIVELVHLKQPSEEVGPLTVLHDHSRGFSSIYEGTDLQQAIDVSSNGMTVHDAASLMFQTDTPNRNEIEKARRRLEGMVKNGRVTRTDETSISTVTPIAKYYPSRGVTQAPSTPYRDR